MMKIISYMLFCTLMSIALSACYSTNTKHTKNKINGIWKSDEYEILLELKENRHTFYRNTGDLCLTVPLNDILGFNHEQLLDDIIISDDKSTLITTLGARKSPGIEMLNIRQLPDYCRSQ